MKNLANAIHEVNRHVTKGVICVNVSSFDEPLGHVHCTEETMREHFLPAEIRYLPRPCTEYPHEHYAYIAHVKFFCISSEEIDFNKSQFAEVTECEDLTI